MSLTREQILAADDRPKKAVAVAEWGGEVWVKTLSAAQREEWEASISDANGAMTKRQIRAGLVAASACDENGVAIFTKDDVAALADKAASIIMRIYDAAVSLNEITKEDIDAAEKNSDPSPSDSSASA